MAAHAKRIEIVAEDRPVLESWARAKRTRFCATLTSYALDRVLGHENSPRTSTQAAEARDPYLDRQPTRSSVGQRTTSIAGFRRHRHPATVFTPRELIDDDLRSLCDLGLTLEETWGVAEIAAMYNPTNRMAMATNMLPNEPPARLAR